MIHRYYSYILTSWEAPLSWPVPYNCRMTFTTVVLGSVAVGRWTRDQEDAGSSPTTALFGQQPWASCSHLMCLCSPSSITLYLARAFMLKALYCWQRHRVKWTRGYFRPVLLWFSNCISHMTTWPLSVLQMMSDEFKQTTKTLYWYSQFNRDNSTEILPFYYKSCWQLSEIHISHLASMILIGLRNLYIDEKYI